jgi:NADPH:quinone reductase-like Zn-dependent oxidoreductase/SAM-dependent methyltransferase
MEPMLDEFERVATQIKYTTPRIRLISNVNGQPVTNEVTQPSYWRKHVRAAVRFADSIETLHQLGLPIFVEIGPSPTLLGMGKRCRDDDTGLWLPSLRPGQDDGQTILSSLGALAVQGVAVDWRGFDQPYARRKLALPTYPFQRERYWLAPASRKALTAPRAKAVHPLLGAKLRSASKDVQYEAEISVETSQLLNDHRVFETALLPAVAYLEAFTAAAQMTLDSEACRLEDVAIHAGLIVPDEASCVTQVIVQREDQGKVSLQFFSSDPDTEEWQLHASANARIDQATAAAVLTRAVIQARCETVIEAETHYQQLRDHGLVFGPSLRGVQRMWRRPGEALGEIELPEVVSLEAAQYGIHPALLDACLQVVAAAVADDEGTYLPIGIDDFRVVRRPVGTVWSYVQIRSSQAAQRATLTADLQVFDETEQLVVEARGLQFKRADRTAFLGRFAGGPEFADWLYEVAWPEQPRHDNSFMPKLATLIDNVQLLATPLAQQHHLALYTSLLPQLEALSLDYVIEAFKQLGWAPRAGQRMTTEALAQQLGVIAQHQQLLGRLLEILSEDGLLRRQGADWEAVRELPNSASEPRQQAALARFPESAELKLLGRCGPQLAGALNGQVDPLQLLFPGGTFDAAEQLYHHSPSARTYNSLVAEAITATLARLPQGRTVRLLEIGAGTGGTTTRVLPVLPADRVEYTFTDISPLFAARAQQTFAAYAFVRYQALDIEQDPIAQGLTPQHYDIILAANVIHATADLHRTLDHVKQLLSPEGLLIMIEVNQPQRWIDLTFGLTDGWWRFVDRDLRPAYPLLSQAQWLQLLTNEGFTQVAALPSTDADPDFAVQSIVLGRGPLTPPTAGRWLIWADGGGTADRLVTALKDRGARSVLVQPGTSYAQLAADRWQIDPARPDDAARVLREAFATEPCLGAVQLWNLDQSKLPDTSADLMLGTGGTLHLAQALIKAGWPAQSVPRLWLITRRAQAVRASEELTVAQAPAWGLGKTIGLEHPELHCTRIDVDQLDSPQAIETLVHELLLADAEDQIAYRDGVRHVARLAHPAVDQPDRSSRRLEITVRGTFDNLVLAPLTRRAPAPGEVEIEVQATGLNFKDVMNVLGMYPGDPGLPGGECAGRIVAVGAGVDDLHVDDEVLALASGSFASFVTVPAVFVVRKPAALNFAEAAAVAIPFVTAHFTLNHLGRLQAGERVLIHAAAGGVGLAAVQLAQRAGAEIFATAGSLEKRAYLTSLGVSHVTDSRSLDFAAEIMSLTGGRGVDMVLNSLAGEFTTKSLSVLAAGGRFLEIGKSDLLTAEQAAQLGRGIAYHIVDWGVTAQQDPALIRSMLLELVALIEAGELKPLPYRAFSIEQAVDAFRYMAQAKHIGKLVITQPSDVIVRDNATYLITGGMGGLGLITARWLVERGARHIVLLGRRDPSDSVTSAIAELEARGAQILVQQGDVSQLADVQRVLTHIQRELPPLRGIIHSAGVLDDGALVQQDWSRFITVLQPKVDGAWHLHQLTRLLPLDFFVLYSSVASLLGSAGQGNHAAANMFMDVLAHWRRAQGLPALSINWGAWSEVGAAVERGVEQRIAAQGVGVISPEQGVRVLDYLLNRQAIQTGVMPIAWAKFAARFDADHILPFLSEMIAQARWTASAVTQPKAIEQQPAAQPTSDWLVRITSAPAAKQRSVMIDYVRGQAGRVLGLDPTRVGERAPLSELGLDSLMAVELRNLLGTGLALPRKLPATLVFDYPTIEAIGDYLLREVLPKPEPVTTAPVVEAARGEKTTAVIDAIEDLSDEEVDRLLAGKLKR